MSATKSTSTTYQVGETVIYQGRVSMIADVSRTHPGIVLVSSYAGSVLIGTDHPDLKKAA